MSTSTVDYAPQVVGSASTPAEALRVVHVYPDENVVAPARDTDIDAIVRALRMTPTPDRTARARLARQLYELTGWLVFQPAEEAERQEAERAGYAELTSEYESEDAERRRIARRRPRAAPDED